MADPPKVFDNSSPVSTLQIMGMSYRRKSLSQELGEFAAKKAIGAVVNAVAKHAEKKLTDTLKKKTHYRDLSKVKPQPKYTIERPDPMGINGQTQNGGFVDGANNNYNRDDKPKTEFWVNFCYVISPDRMTRIGYGRDLKTMRPDKKVTTTNAEFNEDNAVSNALIDQIHARAQSLGKGERLVMCKDEVPEAGSIVIEIYRASIDDIDESIIKADIEGDASAMLQDVFGTSQVTSVNKAPEEVISEVPATNQNTENE